MRKARVESPARRPPGAVGTITGSDLDKEGNAKEKSEETHTHTQTVDQAVRDLRFSSRLVSLPSRRSRDSSPHRQDEARVKFSQFRSFHRHSSRTATEEVERETVIASHGYAATVVTIISGRVPHDEPVSYDRQRIEAASKLSS